jgi:hypothetical protein
MGQAQMLNSLHMPLPTMDGAHNTPGGRRSLLPRAEPVFFSPAQEHSGSRIS